MGHIAKTDPLMFLSIKRARRQLKRAKVERRKAVRRARAQRYQEAKRKAFGGGSLIGKLLSAAYSHPVILHEPSISLQAPKVFSILKNPEEVLRTIGALAKADQEAVLEHIDLNFEKIEVQDLAAQALIAKLVDEIDTSARILRRYPIHWSGTYPKEQAHCRLVKATGVIKQLRVKHEYLAPDEESKLTLFVRHSRNYISKIKISDADEKSKASEKFADYINRCLASSRKRLTDNARHLLCSQIGELLGNAEEHAGLVDWTIKGYLDASISPPTCEIVIFNFGKSLAESFEDLPPNSYTMDQISPYLEKHSKGGLFNPKWRREDLLTVMALQQSVSSKNLSVHSHRGNGMTQLIEFFQRITEQLDSECKSDARMTIISGTTRVLFDGTYRMRVNETSLLNVGGRRPEIIAFNDTNDLMEPPDPNHVMPLEKTMLPGTLISVQFTLPTSSMVSLNGSAS
jgi:hypothetical protein